MELAVLKGRITARHRRRQSSRSNYGTEEAVHAELLDQT